MSPATETVVLKLSSQGLVISQVSHG